MLSPDFEQYLRTTLTASAGGYLRNTVRVRHRTCLVCTTPVESNSRTLCLPCGRHRHQHGLADLVAPTVYAVKGGQSGYMMRGYKAYRPVDQNHRVVTMITLLTLSQHGGCSARLLDVPVTHWASVPSLPEKPGPHPFNLIVRRSAPGIEVPLKAAPAATVSDVRAVSSAHFATSYPLPPGSHVLLLDDTWASGSHVQSAALALRRAGAHKVSALVVARWIKPNFGGNAAFLKSLSDYDPMLCPWTGGTCP
jgi:hypothetical protein